MHLTRKVSLYPVSPAAQCSGGQVYQECGHSCGGSCSDGWNCEIATDGTGVRMCVPGCQCPSGLVQDHEGQCVPISMCPCLQGDKTYQPGSVLQNNCNTWYVQESYSWCQSYGHTRLYFCCSFSFSHKLYVTGLTYETRCLWKQNQTTMESILLRSAHSINVLELIKALCTLSFWK